MLTDEYKLPRREATWRGVYRNLRIAILNGELTPNARLVEVDLARAMGVSRTPLREALAQLRRDGLISSAERGGYILTDPRQDILDSYHVRAAIEGYAARLAAENITNVEIQALRANVAENAVADLSDTVRRAKLNLAFHCMVAKAARSPRIQREFENLSEFIFTDEDMTLHSIEDARQFVHEHGLLINALELRDGDAADRIVRAHLHRAAALLRDKGGDLFSSKEKRKGRNSSEAA
jgi:DNA-binding GntR family transcriptional regulator